MGDYAHIELARELSRKTDIGHGVIERAKDIFTVCGCEADYCIQYMNIDSVVFGRTNTLLWSSLHGFHPDCSYCTNEFLARFALYVRESE